MNKSLLIARKEFADAITSKRFWLIVGLFLLLYIASSYVISFEAGGPSGSFPGTRLLLRATSNVSTTMTYMAPLLGIALAFDAISGERERGTLRILLSRPIYREDVINGKIVSALAVIGLTIVASSVLSVSASILLQGFAVTPDDIVRLCLFVALAILFSFAYYSISLLISTFSNKSSSSLTISVGVWIFFALILPMLASLIGTAILGPPPTLGRGGSFNFTQGQPGQAPQAYITYQNKLSQITNTIQLVSINHHFSQIASALFSFTGGPFSQQVTQIDLGTLLSSHWIDLLVVVFFPLIFAVASYIVFTTRQEK